MLNTLPLSLLRYAVEHRLILYLAALNNRHTSILRGELRAVFQDPTSSEALGATSGESLALIQAIKNSPKVLSGGDAPPLSRTPSTRLPRFQGLMLRASQFGGALTVSRRGDPILFSRIGLDPC